MPERSGGDRSINMNYLTKIGNVDENWNAKYCIGMASHPRTRVRLSVCSAVAWKVLGTPLSFTLTTPIILGLRVWVFTRTRFRERVSCRGSLSVQE